MPSRDAVDRHVSVGFPVAVREEWMLLRFALIACQAERAYLSGFFAYLGLSHIRDLQVWITELIS